MSGLTDVPSEVVRPGRVGESAFHMECKHTMSQDIKSDDDTVTTTVVFGRVVRFHVIEPLVEEGPRGLPQVNYEKYKPLGRIGGDDWLFSGDYFSIPRPER